MLALVAGCPWGHWDVSTPIPLGNISWQINAHTVQGLIKFIDTIKMFLWDITTLFVIKVSLMFIFCQERQCEPRNQLQGGAFITAKLGKGRSGPFHAAGTWRWNNFTEVSSLLVASFLLSKGWWLDRGFKCTSRIKRWARQKRMEVVQRETSGSAGECVHTRPEGWCSCRQGSLRFGHTEDLRNLLWPCVCPDPSTAPFPLISK